MTCDVGFFVHSRPTVLAAHELLLYGWVTSSTHGLTMPPLFASAGYRWLPRRCTHAVLADIHLHSSTDQSKDNLVPHEFHWGKGVEGLRALVSLPALSHCSWEHTEM